MTLHGICLAARQCVCVCGASPGQPCACRPDGVHMARIARARAAGLIALADFAEAVHGADRFTGYSLLLDEDVAP